MQRSAHTPELGTAVNQAKRATWRLLPPAQQSWCTQSSCGSWGQPPTQLFLPGSISSQGQAGTTTVLSTGVDAPAELIHLQLTAYVVVSKLVHSWPMVAPPAHGASAVGGQWCAGGHAEASHGQQHVHARPPCRHQLTVVCITRRKADGVSGGVHGLGVVDVTLGDGAAVLQYNCAASERAVPLPESAAVLAAAVVCCWDGFWHPLDWMRPLPLRLPCQPAHSPEPPSNEAGATVTLMATASLERVMALLTGGGGGTAHTVGAPSRVDLGTHVGVTSPMEQHWLSAWQG